jgi:cation:H+ antiporter
LVSKVPFIVVVAAFSMRARTDRATSALLAAQIGQLTVLTASVPLAFYLQGLLRGDAGSLALDGRQSSELLLTSAQTLFMVVVVARMSVSSRGAMAIFGLFVLQSALAFAQPRGESTTAQDLMSALYIGAAVLAISRDRSRLQTLLAMFPVRRGKGDGDNVRVEKADS